MTEPEPRGLDGSVSAIALRKAPSEAKLPDTPAPPGPTLSMNQVLWSHPADCASVRVGHSNAEAAEQSLSFSICKQQLLNDNGFGEVGKKLS